jgi:hypothetical protein
MGFRHLDETLLSHSLSYISVTFHSQKTKRENQPVTEHKFNTDNITPVNERNHKPASSTSDSNNIVSNKMLHSHLLHGLPNEHLYKHCVFIPSYTSQNTADQGQNILLGLWTSDLCQLFLTDPTK